LLHQYSDEKEREGREIQLLAFLFKKVSMKKAFVFLFTAVSMLALFQNCRKGERVDVQQYMRFKLEAFYPDSALFYQVTLNDSLLSEFSGHSGNSFINLVNSKKEQLPWVDSARLKVTVVKKNGKNILLDSVIYLTNDNDFLLLQTDDKLPPTFINKKIAAVTERKPGKDSLRVRFFFNDYDEIRRNGNLLKTIELQVYSYRRDSLGGVDEPPLRFEGRYKGIVSGQLTPYISLRYQNEDGLRNFVFDIYPPSNNPATQPQYRHVYDEIDGFIGGNLPVELTNGTLQTFRITKSEFYTPGRIGLFLFGLK
jgi:hypothetical protein